MEYIIDGPKKLFFFFFYLLTFLNVRSRDMLISRVSSPCIDELWEKLEKSIWYLFIILNAFVRLAEFFRRCSFLLMEFFYYYSYLYYSTARNKFFKTRLYFKCIKTSYLYIKVSSFEIFF